MALKFLKMNNRPILSLENFNFTEAHFEALGQIPDSTFLFAKQGVGLGHDAVIVSLHKT
jgi:hypothetical protein